MEVLIGSEVEVVLGVRNRCGGIDRVRGRGSVRGQE
mgnify:CR=1 FL=1